MSMSDVDDEDGDDEDGDEWVAASLLRLCCHAAKMGSCLSSKMCASRVRSFGEL